MAYETKVRIDDRGTIQKKSLVTITPQDWSDWVKDQLHNQRKVFPFVDGEAPESLFLGLIPHLDSPQRFKAYEGVKQCLDKAYEIRKNKTVSAVWGDVPLDDLFSLVGGIESICEKEDYRHQDVYFGIRQEQLTRFLDVVEAKPSFTFFEENRDLYFRVLQALCGTEAKLSYEFWAKHLEKSPAVYGSVCFSGAANNSPSDGITLLSHVDWSDEEARIRMEGSLLSFYYENHKFTDIIEAIERKKLELPTEAHDVFEQAQEGAAELVEKDKRGEF